MKREVTHYKFKGVNTLTVPTVPLREAVKQNKRKFFWSY